MKRTGRKRPLGRTSGISDAQFAADIVDSIVRRLYPVTTVFAGQESQRNSLVEPDRSVLRTDRKFSRVRRDNLQARPGVTE